MAEDFEIRFDTAATRRYLEQLRRQAAFILARTLTLTAKDAQARIMARMPTIFDRPTRFTLNATKVEIAKKDTLIASVGYRYQAGRYLVPQVSGDSRRDKGAEHMLRARGFLPDSLQAVPAAGAKLDKSGNLSENQLMKMLSSVRALGEEGRFANKRADGKILDNEHYFLANADTLRAAHLMPGIYRKFPKTDVNPKGRIIPALAFVQAPDYQPRFDILGIVEETARERFLENLEAVVEITLATAR